MDKKNLVFNHVLKKEDFDYMQDASERAIDGVGKAVGKGILSGLDVTVTKTELSVSPGVCFDGLGHRIEVTDSFSFDEGDFPRPSSSDKGKWCAVCIKYKTMDQGDVIDGNNKQWPERVLDSYEHFLHWGNDFYLNGSGGIGTLEDDWVIVCYIRLERNIALDHMECEDRPRLKTLAEHEKSAITSSNTVHGIRQKHGGGFDADMLDGAHRGTDGNLSGNSDDSIPTERAVKTYVNTNINAIHNYQRFGKITRVIATPIAGESSHIYHLATIQSTVDTWRFSQGYITIRGYYHRPLEQSVYRVQSFIAQCSLHLEENGDCNILSLQYRGHNVLQDDGRSMNVWTLVATIDSWYGYHIDMEWINLLRIRDSENPLKSDEEGVQLLSGLKLTNF